MAKALNQLGGASAIATLEEAVHLLRRTPASVWVCHWTGCAPFALELLFIWGSVSNPRTSSATTAASALAMSILLVWMNCWRAVFAVRLRRLLSGSCETAWTSAQVSNLVARHSWLAA